MRRDVGHRERLVGFLLTIFWDPPKMILNSDIDFVTSCALMPSVGTPVRFD